ncbi:hypothetical protein Taro_027876 [Colocasia esculenta]|uniref:Uncharacterized protein n=1 Tax=Colocasia esculenta TaxID=4460 RepID=A0A843VF09_COLES|nr:hypothetical protein [Colocasia esculenta]
MPGEPKSRVTVLAKSTSVSSTPVKQGKTYPLSPLDHAMARHSLHLVFYYAPAAATAAGMGRDRLKESLSEVLTNYPPVTGRLTSPAEEGGNWVVRCNDAGVRVLDARVGCSLEEWLRETPAAAERELAQWEAMGEDRFIWSPFCIQISEFECGGVAIGVSCAHMYADATCATLFVKAWGDVHRRACIANPPFFHPPGLCARGPDLNLSTSSASFLQSKSSSPAAAPPSTCMSTATFRFPDAAVRRCLADLKSACPDATPFDALASLFWWRSRVAAAAGGPSSLTVCVDFRKMMYAPLPHGYFGNSLHFSRVDADLGPGGADAWASAAGALRAHAAGLVEEEFWSAVEWVESRRDAATGAFAPAFQMYGPDLTCASLDHLFSYGAAFGKDAAAPGEAGAGRPAHVAYHVGGAEGEGLILVLPGPPEEGGATGRTVMVTLPQDQTDRIRRDEVILNLGATPLFAE